MGADPPAVGGKIGGGCGIGGSRAGRGGSPGSYHVYVKKSFMSKKPTLHVAYGSNVNLPQMVLRCSTAEVMVTGELRDLELLFRGSRSNTVATVEPKEDSSVPMLLWKIKEKDETSFDRYEGYPHFYDRRHMKVGLDRRAVSIMVYIMTPGHELSMPSGWYVSVIRQDYETAGLNVQVLIDAIDHAQELFAEQRQSRLQSMFGMGGQEQQK